MPHHPRPPSLLLPNPSRPARRFSDPAASALVTGLMQADRAAALALMAPSLSASEAADLAPLTDAAWNAMKLWLINLLPTWGRLVYTSWLHAGQAGPGAGGLFVTKSVRELLYGEAGGFSMAKGCQRWGKTLDHMASAGGVQQDMHAALACSTKAGCLWYWRPVGCHPRASHHHLSASNSYRTSPCRLVRCRLPPSLQATKTLC